MTNSSPSFFGSVSAASLVVVSLCSGLLAVLWAPVVASLLLPALQADGPFVAGHYTLAAGIVGLLSGSCAASSRRSGLIVALLVGVLAAGVLAALGSMSFGGGATLLLLSVLCGSVARGILLRLPGTLEPFAVARPVLAIGWVLLTVGCIFQVSRLATHVCDQSDGFVLSTADPTWAQHLCMPGYLYGAELNERGEENVYAAEHYPLWNPEVVLGSRYDFAEPDDFMYPPPFLLLPRAVIALSDNFQLIYSAWFAIQTMMLLAAALALASWIGGKAGGVAALALPLLLISFPVLFNLQFGQFHLAAILLAMFAMLQFQKNRNAAGGFLLGFAIVAKLFPGLLLIWLAGQKQWKALVWVGVASLVYVGVALLVVGPEPFVAFLSYEMPRLSSGAAFWYDDLYPEFASFLVADLQSPYGVVLKLDAIGFPGMTRALGAMACKVFGIALLLLTFRVSRIDQASRTDKALLWLSLLGLGSLVNTGAWGDYIAIPALWMLTLLIPHAAKRRALIIPLILTAVFQFFTLGSVPIGSWYDIEYTAPLSLCGAVLLYGLYTWRLVRRPIGGPLEAQ